VVTALRSVFDLNASRFGDVNPGLHAARRLSHDGRAPLYDQITAKGSSFIYPPLAAALYRPFARMEPEAAHHALALTDHVVFILIVVVLVAFVHGQAGRPRVAPVVAVAAALVFYPLLRAVEINQAGLVVTLLVGAAHLALSRGRSRAAGVAIALACGIKPHLVLVLPLLAFASPALVLAALTAGTVLLALSLVFAGLANHVAYVTQVLPQLSAGYVFAPNQSWTALFGRFLLDADIREFVLSPRDVRVEVLAALTGAIGYGVAVLAIRRGGRADLVGALGLAWLVVTPLSPIAWEHHYAPALFVLAWAWSGCRRLGMDVPLLAVACAFALMGSAFDVRGLHGAVARLLVSYVLFGALLLQAVGTSLLLRTPP
jgi:hypothetical protein